MRPFFQLHRPWRRLLLSQPSLRTQPRPSLRTRPRPTPRAKRSSPPQTPLKTPPPPSRTLTPGSRWRNATSSRQERQRYWKWERAWASSADQPEPSHAQEGRKQTRLFPGFLSMSWTVVREQEMTKYFPRNSGFASGSELVLQQEILNSWILLSAGNQTTLKYWSQLRQYYISKQNTFRTKLKPHMSIFAPFPHHCVFPFACFLHHVSSSPSVPSVFPPPSFHRQHVSDDVCVVDSSPPSALPPDLLPSSVEYPSSLVLLIYVLSRINSTKTASFLMGCNNSVIFSNSQIITLLQCLTNFIYRLTLSRVQQLSRH